MPMFLRLARGLLALCLLASPALAQADWPRFLGPNATGAVASPAFDFDWPDEGPAVAWRVEVGPGFGGAAVRDGEVYLLDREVGEVDILRVLDLETGEDLWDAVYESPGRLMYQGSRSVPTVTESHVFTCGGMGRVTCYDRDRQEEVWSVHLEEDYGGNMPTYGWACSPLVIGDTVVVTALGDEIGLVAFDTDTGEELWVSPPVGISHSTPVLLDLLGVPQIVFLSSPPGPPSLDQAGTLTISSFSPEDGSLLWEFETTGSTYPIPGPVQVGEDRLFVTGGYRGGSALLRIAREDGAYSLEREFYIERGAQVHNPIFHEDHLYLQVNENWNQSRARRKEGGLLCLTLQGEEAWRTGADPNFGRGNAVLAGDHLLLQDGYDGTLRVVEATPEGYSEVASANVFGIDDRRDHEMWGAMALAGNRLLMRSQDTLLCIELTPRDQGRGSRAGGD